MIKPILSLFLIGEQGSEDYSDSASDSGKENKKKLSKKNEKRKKKETNEEEETPHERRKKILREFKKQALPPLELLKDMLVMPTTSNLSLWNSICNPVDVNNCFITGPTDDQSTLGQNYAAKSQSKWNFPRDIQFKKNLTKPFKFILRAYRLPA